MLQTIPTLAPFLAPLARGFRAEAFAAFCWACYGWLIASGTRTLSGVWQALGHASDLSHHALYRLFHSAAWDDDALARAEAHEVLRQFVPHGPVAVVIGDTLCHKRGAGVFGSGMYLDAVLSSRRHTVIRCGINYVVLGVVVRLPSRPDRDFCLPVAWRVCGKAGTRGAATRTARAAELIAWLAASFPDRRFRVACDSAYMCRRAWANRPANVEALGPVPMSAALHAPPPPPTGARGRPRVRGDRLPTPRVMADGPARPVRVRVNGKTKTLEVREAGPLLWYNTFGGHECRLVVVHDPSGGWEDVALLCTDAHLGAASAVEGYCRRWSIEVAFRDSKRHLGLHEPQGRSAASVTRAHPMAWRALTLAVRWHAANPEAEPVARSRPWYPHKRGVSVTDMLGALRLQLWREGISSDPRALADPQHTIEMLLHRLAAVG